MFRRLARHDRRRVTRDVADDRFAQRLLDQRLVNAGRHIELGQFGERPRERRLARHGTDAFPAAQPAQRRIDRQPLDQHRSGRQIEHRLGHERTRQCWAILWRTARPSVDHLHERLDAHHPKNGDEPLMILGQRPHLGPETREKMPLNVVEGI